MLVRQQCLTCERRYWTDEDAPIVICPECAVVRVSCGLCGADLSQGANGGITQHNCIATKEKVNT